MHRLVSALFVSVVSNLGLTTALEAQGAAAAADVAAVQADLFEFREAANEFPSVRSLQELRTITLPDFLRRRATLEADLAKARVEALVTSGISASCSCCCKPTPTKKPAFVFALGPRFSYFGGSEPKGYRLEWALSTNILGSAAGKFFGALGGTSLAKELENRVFIDLAGPVEGDLDGGGLTSSLSIRLVTIGTKHRLSASYVMQSFSRTLADTTSSVFRDAPDEKTFSSPGVRVEFWKMPNAGPAAGATFPLAAYSVSLDIVSKYASPNSPGEVAKNLFLTDPPEFISWERWQVSLAFSLSFWVMR